MLSIAKTTRKKDRKQKSTVCPVVLGETIPTHFITFKI